jgi:hypothetical protein
MIVYEICYLTFLRSYVYREKEGNQESGTEDAIQSNGEEDAYRSDGSRKSQGSINSQQKKRGQKTDSDLAENNKRRRVTGPQAPVNDGKAHLPSSAANGSVKVKTEKAMIRVKKRNANLTIPTAENLIVID